VERFESERERKVISSTEAKVSGIDVEKME